MKKIHILMSVVLLGLLTSCLKDQEDVFDKSSAVRAEEAIAANYKILAGAEHGWLMKYYPSPYRTYGGYNFIMKFSEDGKVVVAGDVVSPNATAESLFKITQSAGVVLSFDTYNEIFHLVSTPDAPLGGSAGEGWEGDYDFEFISATADKIVLKGKKSGNYATLTPMADDNWSDYLTEVAEVEDAMYFTKYSMKVGDTDVQLIPSNRSLDVTYQKNDQDTTLSVPFIVTPEGYEFYEPIEINGQEIHGFKYVENSVNYPCSDNEAIVLNGIIPPINETLVYGLWGTSLSNIGTFGTPYWEAFRDSALPWFNQYYPGTLSYFYFGSYDGSWGAIYVLCGFLGINGFDYKLVGDDEIALIYNAKGDSINGGAFFSYGIMQYLLAPFGCDVEGNPLERTFKVEGIGTNPKRPEKIILTDKDTPTNVITLVDADIADPLSN